jgi:hypothetical protein
MTNKERNEQFLGLQQTQAAMNQAKAIAAVETAAKEAQTRYILAREAEERLAAVDAAAKKAQTQAPTNH